MLSVLVLVATIVCVTPPFKPRLNGHLTRGSRSIDRARDNQLRV
jgi:hypothetical protein